MTRSALSQNASDDVPLRVIVWLYCVALMILIMAVVGAITRLTESGLSIMEWAPITGALPPLSEAEWQRLFAIYKQIPEYTEQNFGMSLAEFKQIFWWEYIHRLWGRMIGLAFALPLAWFWMTGALIRPGLKRHLIFALLLGGLQGFMGWFMVASGFADRIDVSQYRLVMHLGLALVIFAYLTALAISLQHPAETNGATVPLCSLRKLLWVLLVLVSVTIASGGFVAGINAGLTYNSFPLMDGQFIPDGYFQLQPWYLNFFENVTAVQFDHRLLAMLTFCLVPVIWMMGMRTMVLSSGQRLGLHLLLVMACVQVALGIATLLLVVPIHLAATHQAGAVILLGLTVNALVRLRAPTTR